MNERQFERLVERTKPLHRDDPLVAHAFDSCKANGTSVDGALIAALKDVARQRDALVAAIRRHMGAKGHESCHLNDQELYSAIGEGMPDRELPPEDEFLVMCHKYYKEQRG